MAGAIGYGVMNFLMTSTPIAMGVCGHPYGDAAFVISAHVIAMEDSGLLVLRREDFYARLRSSPEVAIALLREISRRLRRADEKIGSLVLLDVNGRVAHLLLRMADDEGGDRITRKLTHHTIAQMIGSSRETVSRTMRNLVERGIIQVTRKEITLRDRRSLMLAARRA